MQGERLNVDSSVTRKQCGQMQTTAARLQEKLLKPEVRQKGKEQVKEKARDSVLQLLSRLQAEQAQNKPAAQPRTQEGHSVTRNWRSAYEYESA